MRFDLPDYVIAEGERIPVRVDFRYWIALETAVWAGDSEGIGDAVARLLPEDIPCMEPDVLFSAVMGFYSLRNPYPVLGGEAGGKGKNGGKRSPRWYDFNVDFGRLTASFRAVYGIDLYRDSLHWAEFRVLMFNLPEDCEFMRVVGYRLADLSALPKAQRKHYREMKAIYALEDDRRRFATLEDRDGDMLRRMERIREEMRENVGR